MARPAPAKRYPTGRAGNYAAPVDTSGMDVDMAATLIGTHPNRIEQDYIAGTKRKSAVEAVRRARKANLQPPLRMPNE